MNSRGSILGKVLRILALLAAGLVGGVLAFIWYIGAWNAIFPSSDHDEVAPKLPKALGPNSVLVFTKTNGFRHTEGISGGTAVIKRIAKKQEWSVFFTENGAVFNPEQLARFRAVVFLNTTGDTLSDQQQADFQQWMEAGGGWLGIHAAGDGSHADWQWYMDNLVGAEFTAHIMSPQFQTATVHVEDAKHPAMRHLPETFEHEEEWYSWAASPREKGFHILATVDEDSYTPVQKIFGNEVDLRMGDHPVAWANCINYGRSLYFTMGHTAEAFSVKEVRIMLRDSLSWVMGLKSGGNCKTSLSFG